MASKKLSVTNQAMQHIRDVLEAGQSAGTTGDGMLVFQMEMHRWDPAKSSYSPYQKAMDELANQALPLLTAVVEGSRRDRETQEDGEERDIVVGRRPASNIFSFQIKPEAVQPAIEGANTVLEAAGEKRAVPEPQKPEPQKDTAAVHPPEAGESEEEFPPSAVTPVAPGVRMTVAGSAGTPVPPPSSGDRLSSPGEQTAAEFAFENIRRGLLEPVDTVTDGEVERKVVHLTVGDMNIQPHMDAVEEIAARAGLKIHKVELGQELADKDSYDILYFRGGEGEESRKNFYIEIRSDKVPDAIAATEELQRNLSSPTTPFPGR